MYSSPPEFHPSVMQTQRVHRPEDSPTASFSNSAALSAQSEAFVPSGYNDGARASDFDSHQFLGNGYNVDQFRTTTAFAGSRPRFAQSSVPSLYNDLGSSSMDLYTAQQTINQSDNVLGRPYDYDLPNQGFVSGSGLFSGSALPQSHHVQVNKAAMQQQAAQQLLQQQQPQQAQLQSNSSSQFLNQLHQSNSNASLHNAAPYNQYNTMQNANGLVSNVNSGAAPIAPTLAQEEISTIFVVGFPDDMQEREFQNMFTFSPGFEAATLKIPNKELTAYGPGMVNSNPAVAAAALRSGMLGTQSNYGGATDPYNLVTVNSGGVVLDSRDLPAPGTASWPGLAEDPYIARTLANLQGGGGNPVSGQGTTAEQLAQHLANPMPPPRKQIIGFAKFRSRQEALEARDVLQGRRVDVEKGAVLKAEMAKKNLHTKRGVGPLGLPLVMGANGVATEALSNLTTMNGMVNLASSIPVSSSTGAVVGLGGIESMTQRERDSAAVAAMGLSGILKRPKDEREREAYRDREDRSDRWKVNSGSAVYDAFHSVPAALPSRPSVSTSVPSLSSSNSAMTSAYPSSLSGYLSPTDGAGRLSGYPFTPVSMNGNPGTSPLPSSAIPQGRPPSPPMSGSWTSLHAADENDEMTPNGTSRSNTSYPSPTDPIQSTLQHMSSSSSSNSSSIRDVAELQESSPLMPMHYQDQQAHLMTLSPPESHMYPQRLPSHQGSYNNLNAMAVTRPPPPAQFPASESMSASEGSSSPPDEYTLPTHEFRLQTDPTSASASFTHSYYTTSNSLANNSSSTPQPPTSQEDLLRAVAGLAIATSQGMTSPQLPSPGSGAGSNKGNAADQNPPINTLYVGNLPSSPPTSPPNTYLEDSLRAVFSRCPGYRKLCFRQKTNGPMCFVEFDDVHYATKALNELYGHNLSGLVKGGIRLSFSKNPLGVRTPSMSNGSGTPLAHGSIDQRFGPPLTGIQEGRYPSSNSTRQAVPASNFGYDAVSRGRQDSFDIRQSVGHSPFDPVPGRPRQESMIDLRQTGGGFGFETGLGRSRQDSVEARQLNNFTFEGSGSSIIGRGRQESIANEILPSFSSATSPPSRFFSPPPRSSSSSSNAFGTSLNTNLSSSFGRSSTQSFALPSTTSSFSPFASAPGTRMPLDSSSDFVRPDSRQRSPLPPASTTPP